MRPATDRIAHATETLFINAQKRMAQLGVPQLQRAGVPASGTSDLPYISEAEGLIPQIEEGLVLSNLPGAQPSEVARRLIITAGGAVAFALGEKKPARVVPVEFDPVGLTGYKFGAMTVRSNESVMAGGAVTKRGVQNALTRGVYDVTNSYILSDQAASAAAPAGFGYGVVPIAATSDPVADIRALIAAHSETADITSSAFITDPLTAAVLGTVTGPDGGLLFPDVGVAGGTLLGLPVLVTKGSPLEGSPATGRLYLVDGSAVTYSLDGIELSESTQATVELSTAPTGDGDVPAPASQQMSSLFQAELTAFLLIIRCSWRVGRSGAVSILAGIDYQ